MPHINKIEKIKSGKWLSLEKISYTDVNGKKCNWESVSRISSKGAVLIIAILKPSEKIVLIRQFRPPAHSYVIEFPAGLLDDGETIETAALRELEEECGLRGKLSKVTNPFYSSPGMSSETVAFALVEIDESDSSSFVKTKFDHSENIETFLVTIDQIPKFLNEREKLGDKIDAKIAAFSICINEIVRIATIQTQKEK